MTDLPIAPIVLHAAGWGTPLVLLHGLGTDHRFWDVAAPLADVFRLVRYDLPGHGATPVPAEPYGIEDLSQQLADLFRAQGIGRAHVAGWSLGGLVALHFAAHFPALVDRLALIGTVPRYPAELRAGWAARAAAVRRNGVGALVDDLMPIWFSDRAVHEAEPPVQAARAMLAAAPAEGYALACEALAAADLLAEAPRVTARTLVMSGGDDVASVTEAAHWLVATIPHATAATIPGTRHAAVLERPEAALRLLRDFFTAD
ncbi:alpha/beta fold hydrolase [Rhodoplanes serenus]|uniref:Alpha/beta fold hydrolase n=1 Tax=Rhodoplanes serenus TaxID=200615 RepID=A0A9X4XHB8_9BRAD|nr:alpha/beta fold hydrolase [Rhodoplanes serenus]MTW15013.1 alpha/beta fold hydrolase [Rhodoplanes serenus]